MTVYLDVVFVLNGGINYLLLYASARIVGAVAKRARLAGAAVLGALYACGTFLPGFAFLAEVPWRVVALLAMLTLAFGVGRRLLLLGAVFLALSLALGGLVQVLSSFLGIPVWILRGRVYYAVGFPTLVLTAGALYLGAWLLLQGSMAHTGGIVTARLELKGRQTSLSFLRDTGNTLKDPFTGCAVPVVEAGVIARLLPEAKELLSLSTNDCAKAMAGLHETLPDLSLRLIPYRAVGTKQALLLAVRCDKLCVEDKTRRDIYVAVSPNRVSEHGDFEGLIGEGE